MSAKLPENRQFRHILLSQEDGWALRELIKPFDAAEKDQERQISFCQRVYECLLRMIVAGEASINMAVDVEDCLLINQNLKSGAYAGADSLLLQTWQVLHEFTYDAPFVASYRLTITSLLVLPEEGKEDAIHRAGEPEQSQERESAPDAGRAELPVYARDRSVPESSGHELQDVQ